MVATAAIRAGERLRRQRLRMVRQRPQPVVPPPLPVEEPPLQLQGAQPPQLQAVQQHLQQVVQQRQPLRARQRQPEVDLRQLRPLVRRLPLRVALQPQHRVERPRHHPEGQPPQRQGAPLRQAVHTDARHLF